MNVLDKPPSPTLQKTDGEEVAAVADPSAAEVTEATKAAEQVQADKQCHCSIGLVPSMPATQNYVTNTNARTLHHSPLED